MQRLLAIALAVVLVSASRPTSALHVHAATDHDHPEHHHGPAIHEHDSIDDHDSIDEHYSNEPQHDDDRARMEGCNPARHAVNVAFVCGVAAQPLSLDGEMAVAVAALPNAASGCACAVTDVRVHGPPPGTQASPRAPPSSVTAPII